jgi:hypothetical protein
MKMTKEVIDTWVTNNLHIGRSKQEVEEDFKQMLKAKLIGVDDYSNAMEAIYGE